MLTEGSVRVSDKRAHFIGIDAYVDAGGTVLNDLFQSDDGGWLEDVALVDRLVAEKLDREAEAIRARAGSGSRSRPTSPTQAVPADAESGPDTAKSEPATASEPDEDNGLRPIPDRLMTELTAHRTLALRLTLGGQPDIAFLAALHALCIKVFYRYAVDSCVEIDLKSAAFGSQAPGLKDTELAASFERRHQD